MSASQLANVIDNDIITLSKQFLAENAHFVVKLGVVEARAVSNWLQTQLLREREGWKNQLATSLKEIERQRKLAQAWETRYKDVCGRLLFGSDNESVEESSGTRSKENRRLFERWRDDDEEGLTMDAEGEQERLLCALRLRNEQLEDRIRRLRTEKEECLSLLGAGEALDKGGTLVQILKKRLKEIEQKYRENRDAVLRKTKKDLAEVRVKAERYLEEAAQLKNQLDEARLTRDVKHSLTVLNYGGTSHAVMAANLKAEKLKSILSETRKTMQEAVTEREAKIQRLCDQLDALDREMNAKEDQIARYEKQIQSYKVLTSYNPAFRTPAVIMKPTLNEKLKSDGSNNSNYTLPEMGKIDMIPTATATIPNFIADPLHVEATSSVYSHKFASQSTFLPSLSVGQRSPGRKPVQFSDSTMSLATAVTTQPATKIGVHRCLRCNKLYRLTDNTRLACRFHSKTKKKREKVDMATGKLMDIVYSWDCCGQPLESLGCCRMAHI